MLTANRSHKRHHSVHAATDTASAVLDWRLFVPESWDEGCVPDADGNPRTRTPAGCVSSRPRATRRLRINVRKVALRMILETTHKAYDAGDALQSCHGT